VIVLAFQTVGATVARLYITEDSDFL
jgi:hypothetical protein